VLIQQYYMTDKDTFTRRLETQRAPRLVQLLHGALWVYTRDRQNIRGEGYAVRCQNIKHMYWILFDGVCKIQLRQQCTFYGGIWKTWSLKKHT